MEIIGWIGGILLAFCGLPEAVLAIQTKQCLLSWSFLLMWLIGEILALTYVILKAKKVSLLPLIFNYGLNILFISIMIFYK